MIQFVESFDQTYLDGNCLPLSRARSAGIDLGEGGGECKMRHCVDGMQLSPACRFKPFSFALLFLYLLFSGSAVFKSYSHLISPRGLPSGSPIVENHTNSRLPPITWPWALSS